jgi:signal transduction histidine kinase
MTALRLHPESTRQNLDHLDDLKHLARTEREANAIVNVRQTIERGAPSPQDISELEQLSDYYRTSSDQAHQQLVTFHQWAVQGVIILMGGGTLLLVGMMVMVRRWFIGPLFDVHEAIHLAVANDPTRPLPNNEMRELMAPVCKLAAKTKDLDSRTARAERLASAGEASTRVGQNLRNLIQSLRTTAQRERNTAGVDPAAKAAFENIISTANAMDRWVTSLVNTTRPLDLKACRQTLEPVIRDSVSLLVPLLLERSITIDFDPADTLPDVLLERPLFEQALVAVLKNALDASPDESRIVVTTTGGPDGTARITIADEGEGMSDEVRRRACDPFFTKRKDGVGLGLTYVQRIVELHGGKLALESEPKMGTRVHIDLPALTDSNSTAGEISSAATRPVSSKSSLSASVRR